MKRMSVLAAGLALSSTLTAAQPHAPVKWTLDGDSAALSFDAKRVARGLWFAWGDSDAGGRTNGWARVEKLADVPAQSTGVSVSLPAAFDVSSQKGRFFLFDVYDARSYVQDGLVLHLDARDNAGVGLHDAAASAWKDLAGDCDVTLAGIAYGDSGVVFPMGGRAALKLPMLQTNADKTLETIAWTDETFPADVYARTDVVSVGNDLNFAFRRDSIFMMAIFCDASDADGRQTGRYHYGDAAGIPSASAAGILEPHAYALVQSAADPSASSIRVDGSRYVVAKNGCVWSADFMHTNTIAIGMSTAKAHFSSIRLYSRALDAEELAFNAAVDRVRYFDAEAPFIASPLVPDSADATGTDGFVCASWNIGHFANGTSNASKIPAGEAETWKAAYSSHLDAIGADWFGVCEWSDAFTSDGSVSARDAVFGRYPFASIGPRNSYQCNGAFANVRFTLLETITNRYGSHVQDTYYVAHRVLVDDAIDAWLVQTHNDWAAGVYRTNQADQLIGDFLDKPRVVISGDFNNSGKMADGTASTTAWNYPARFMDAGYHVFNTGVYGATCGGVTIDNFYVKGFAISGGAVHADDGLSDHRAISCRLTPLVPTADGKTPVMIPANPPQALYTGAVQTPYVTSDPGYTVVWEEISASAGEYDGTAALVDPEKTCWTDGTTSPKPLTFKVLQNANRWTSAPSLSPTTWFIEGGDRPSFSQGASFFGTPAANYTDEELAALPVGDYVLTVTVPATESYAGLATNIPFKVAQKFVPTLSKDGRSVGLTFGPSVVDRTLWIVYDEADRGDGLDGWRNLVAVGTVPAGASSWTAALPEDVGARYGAFRFILRTASMGADAYVQNGLVAQWDAIENAGRGVHSDAPAVWKDLAGSRDIPTNSFVFGATSAMLASNVTVAIPFGSVMAASATKTVEGVFHTDGTFDAWNMARMDVLNAGNDGVIAFRNVNDCYRIGIFTDAGRHAFYTYNADAAFAGLSRILSNANYSAVFAPDAAQSSMWINGEAFTKGLATDAGGPNYYYNTVSGFAHNDNLHLQNLSRANLHYASIRVYSRALTDEERNANYAVDKARFLGGDPNADTTGVVLVPVPFHADVDKKGMTADVCLTPTNFVRSLYVAWANGDRGETTNAWTELRRLCDVAAGAGVLKNISLPAEALDATGLRFFLVCEFDAGAYVQDGLLAQWDAIENAGRGVHSDAPAVWKDLAGSRDIPTNSFVFGATSAMLASNVTMTVSFGSALPAASVKTAEGVFRTDGTFDMGHYSRLDLVNVGNDGAIAFRGGGGYYVLGIFTENATRCAFYTHGLGTEHATAARLLKNTPYSAVLAPMVADSSLFVNGEPFTKGVATATGEKNYYHTDNSNFRHDENLYLGKWARANLHYSSIRVYSRALTDDERAYNAMVDKSRYCGETPAPLATPYVRLRNGLSILIR